MPRENGRANDALRPVQFTPNIAPAATGSVLVTSGRTQVICTALVEAGVPRWMKEQGVSGGWLTAEYAMLPASTRPRKPRDSTRGKIDGRSTEIQRLIGRSLRAVVDLELLGERTLWVDCDVLQADGGTRTAAITGACVAVGMACASLVHEKIFEKSPLKQLVAATSVGIVDGAAMLDLNYEEDKAATVDMNVILTEAMEFVEVQGAGEEATFTQEQFLAMLDLGKRGVAELHTAQRALLQNKI
jgi:ribonuclease PH